MEDTPAWSSFWSQLQQRKIFRVSVAYAVVSFVLLQIGDATFESLPLPQPAMLWLLVAMFLLYPLVVIVAWLFEITPGGVVFDRRFARLPRSVEAGFLAGITLVSVGLAMWLLYSAQERRPSLTGFSGVPTIAVLPFDDFSPDQDAAYLSHGIPEQLLTVLNKLQEFNLVGRTSSFYWGRRGLELREVADRLQADHLIEGSVQLDGSRVLVTAQLIEASSMLHVWSESYERDVSDLINLELDIARSIADSLRIALSGESVEALESSGARNSKAYVLSLKAREYLRRPAERETLEIAEQLFEQALASDPQLLDASVGLCQTRLALFRVTELTDAYRKALSTCLKIAGTTPDNTEAYVALGNLNRLVDNLDEALQMFRTAAGRDPASVPAQYGLARTLQSMGRLDEAERAFRRMIAMEPAHWSGYRGYGMFLARQGRFEDAARQFELATEIAPDDANAFSNLGLAHFESGNWAAAQTAWDHALTIERTEPLLFNVATLSYYRRNYLHALETLEEIVSGGHADFRTYGKIGACHRQLGNRAAARESFEKAIALAEERMSVSGEAPWIQAYVASYHANLGNANEARALIEQARSDAPEDQTVNYFAAVVEALNGGPGVEDALHRAIQSGYSSRLLESDPLFAMTTPTP